MDFLKIDDPIQICDIGASPVDETDFIEELLNNTNSQLIGFEPNENEFQKLDKNKKNRSISHKKIIQTLLKNLGVFYLKLK